MTNEEILAIDWNTINHEELIDFCRNWNCETALFTRIVERALDLVFINVQELADEIGEDAFNVESWLKGEGLPQEEWMLLIITDFIQVRLQLYGPGNFTRPTLLS